MGCAIDSFNPWKGSFHCTFAALVVAKFFRGLFLAMQLATDPNVVNLFIYF
jgi:hypothetical protein